LEKADGGLCGHSLCGGGFEVTVGSVGPLKENLLPKLTEAIEKIEGEKESVKLRTHLVQRTSTD
jgi:hypothetical protein